MYEELIQRLEHAAGGPEGIKMAHDAAAAIAALQAENAELKKELTKQTALAQNGASAIDTNKRMADALSRVEAERDAAISDVLHDCEHCNHAVENGACKLIPDGDQFSPDYTDCFDRDGNCDHWEWRGAQGEENDGV